jgi:hypothetical protein
MRDGIHIAYLHECMPIVCITGPTQMFKPNTHLYSVALYVTFYYELTCYPYFIALLE